MKRTMNPTTANMQTGAFHISAVPAIFDHHGKDVAGEGSTTMATMHVTTIWMSMIPIDANEAMNMMLLKTMRRFEICC